jgi:hypothetical protein
VSKRADMTLDVISFLRKPPVRGVAPAAATPASIQSSTGRDSGWDLVGLLASGFTVVVFMPPACCPGPGKDIGKIPGLALMMGPRDRGCPYDGARPVAR